MQDTHSIVSSEAEELILVDSDDKETGYLSKAKCHDGQGILHRAFSLFLFNADGELLLQQRGATKRLWPGFWSNSICSHPRRGESMQVATERRLRDELHAEASLEFVYRFQYQARFGESGAENELCHVYLGTLVSAIDPNRNEIAAVRYISGADVDRELEAAPELFTPWFKMEWQALRGEHAAALRRYCCS